MDNGDLTGLPVSVSSQQQLINRCSVFVSRFATGIIEALASGKPVVYFNPHGERATKFSEPLGAFEIARSSTELADALRRVEADIAAGVDFRTRAARFLQRHAAFGLPDGSDVGARFAAAVTTVLDAHQAKLVAAYKLFLERFDELEPFRQKRPGLVLGDFARSHGAQLNEEEMIGRCFGASEGLMLDVGANFGNSLDVYLGKGWTVHAFEPDPSNRAQLELYWPGCERLAINPEAVADRDGLVVPLYASDESTGISSLSAFTGGHRRVAEVSTVTLATYMKSAAIEHVGFLKVDVEGFDKFVLDGFPWDRDRPDAVLVEFEDAKTVPLGYDVGDVVELLQGHGYTVYVSEWHPVVRYGIPHDWKSLSRYDSDVDLSGTWGNLVAFHADPGEEVLSRVATESVRFVVRSAAAAQSAVVTSARTVTATKGRHSPAALSRRGSPRLHAMLRRWRLAWATRASHPRRRLYAEFANGVREGMPAVFRVAQFCAWTLRAARRHRVATASLAAAIGVAALLPVIADKPNWRPWCWSIAGALIVVAGGLAVGAAASEALRRMTRRQDRAFARSHRKLSRQVSRLRATVDSAAQQLTSETERQVGELSRQMDLLREAVESVREQSAESATRAVERISAMQKAEAAERRVSNYSNIAGFRADDRQFSAEDAAHVQAFWQPKFGLAVPTRQLMYLAHDICRTEDRCEGRLATTVHAAVVRSLALMSLGAGDVELLEVGTLFGVGAGALYRTGARVGQRVRLTLVDPLNRYYNIGVPDPTTGVPLTYDVLSQNLREMSVADSDVRVVVGKRGDDEILAEVSDRQYDYVLIDGNHTLAGVAADIARYGGLVRPGGLLVLGHYDTTEWSQITTFVDRHVLGSRDWECVGTGWRTVILARLSPASQAGTSLRRVMAHSTSASDSS
jgi:FkbM family methyltransferase